MNSFRKKTTVSSPGLEAHCSRDQIFIVHSPSAYLSQLPAVSSSAFLNDASQQSYNNNDSPDDNDVHDNRFNTF